MTHDAVITLSSNGTVTGVAAGRRFRRWRQSWPGRSLRDLVDPANWPSLRTALRRAASGRPTTVLVRLAFGPSGERLMEMALAARRRSRASGLLAAVRNVGAESPDEQAAERVARARQLGGLLTISGRPGRGTEVVVAVPLFETGSGTEAP